MQCGHLQIEDGIADDRYRLRLPRVNHRLKRLVCIGDDGFITLAALRWLSDVDASFVMLDRIGNVLEMLGNWEIARPYNFLLLPMVDPLFGYAFDRRANEKILLVCAFSSKQDQWFDLECVNVYDGKRYKLVNCKEDCNISHNIIFPSQFARLLIEYQEHPEAKSLAPDGTDCKADTRGLLKRAHIVAGEIRYVGKETDRKWEEGDDISVVEFAATEYGRSARVLASVEIRARILEIGINKCARESGFHRANFIRKLVRGLAVKRNSYAEFLSWLGKGKIVNE